MHHDLPRHGIILIPSSHIAAVSQYWTLTHTSSYVRIVHGLRPIVYLQQSPLVTMLLFLSITVFTFLRMTHRELASGSTENQESFETRDNFVVRAKL